MAKSRKNLTDLDNAFTAIEVFAQTVTLSSQGIELLLKNMLNKTSLIKDENLPDKGYQCLVDLIDKKKSTMNSVLLNIKLCLN